MRKKLFLRAVFVAGWGLGLLTGAKAKCPPAEAGVMMKGAAGSQITAVLKVAPEHVRLSTPFEARLTLCGASGRMADRVALDATMPQHRHGMNYKPVVDKVAADQYAVSGLLFHMPGLWRFEALVIVNGKPHRFFHDVIVE